MRADDDDSQGRRRHPRTSNSSSVLETTPPIAGAFGLDRSINWQQFGTWAVLLQANYSSFQMYVHVRRSVLVAFSYIMHNANATPLSYYLINKPLQMHV
jgi:hypothetical protein